jgi:hypothetical protein
MADTSMHAYLLRTDHNYRDAFVAETILRMAKLVEALALRNGLSFDANGELEGVTEEEAEMLRAFVPAVNVNTVREASPIHPPEIQQEVAALDPYAATPDPSVSVKSEKVDPDNVSGEGTYLVSHSSGRPNPNADVEEVSEETLEAIAAGGYFPDDAAQSPAAAAAAAEAAGTPVDPELVATDGDEPTGDADGNGGVDGDEGYGSKTVDELQDELRSRDLPVSGSKAELIDRLEKDDEENGDDGT